MIPTFEQVGMMINTGMQIRDVLGGAGGSEQGTTIPDALNEIACAIEKLRTVIYEYPEEKEQKRDDYRAGLAKTLLCKDSKQNGEVFVMSDCSTFKVYEIRELADRLYVLFSINFDSYDKPEVKAKLDELYEQFKKDNQ